MTNDDNRKPKTMDLEQQITDEEFWRGEGELREMRGEGELREMRGEGELREMRGESD